MRNLAAHPAFEARYEIAEPLAQHRSERAYRAIDRQSGAAVTVTLFDELGQEAAFVAHFRRRARIARDLDHPHLLRTLAYGHVERHYYLVTAHIVGPSLEEALQHPARRGVAAWLSLFGGICSGLAEAHRRALVHGHLTPDRILLRTDTDAIVCLAGPPKDPRRDPEGLDLAYLSPEQVAGETPTAASDVYALGVLLYHACAGALPFPDADAVTQARRQLHDAPPSPRRLNAAIDPALETILLRCLEKDPARRYTDAAQLGVALAALGADAPIEAAADQPASHVRMGSHVAPALDEVARPIPRLMAVPASIEQTSAVARPLLSVVVPTYNEAGRITPTLERVTDYLNAQPYAWELLIADDGSTDSTRLIAHAFAERWPSVRVLTAERNGGKGAAVARGVLAARGAYVVFSDADLATPIEEIGRMLECLQDEGYDVVIGSRAMPDSQILTKQPLSRQVMGKTFRGLVNRMALPGIRDSQCGFKAFRTPVARQIFAGLTVRRFAFDVEVLLRADNLGYRVKEIGVTWSDMAGTTVSPLRDSWRMLRDIRALRVGAAKQGHEGQIGDMADDDLGVALITLHRQGGRGELPLAAVLDRARRAADTEALAADAHTALLATFAVTEEEASLTGRRLARAASETLATLGQSSAVSVDVQRLPLGTPVDRLRQQAARPAGGPALQPLLERLESGAARREGEQRLIDRRKDAWARRRRTLRGLMLLNLVGIVWWLAWLLDLRHAANGPLYGLLILAEAYNLVQVLGYWCTVWHERAPERRHGRVPGAVDVFIATYNEPMDLVAETVRAAVAMPYPHRTYVLDDGKRPEIGTMARRLGAEWITRPTNRGAKAGNINHALSVTDAPFFAVFDADHVPYPEFLDRLLPYMADPQMAFVQAPQYYANRHKTYVAGGAMDQQELFFGPICNGKDGLDAVFCCGTNMVMRREALESVGGFREDSITEDAATSLDLHERGWRSRYVPERLADGLAPEDLGAYISQQRRWARGNLEMLFHARVLRRRMPLRLRFQYAWSAMHYLSGLSTLLYLALPCLFLLFGLQTVSARSGDFIAHFLPYIFVTIFILARSAEGRLRFRAIQLSYGLFPVYIQALISAVSGHNVRFAVTPKEGSTQSFYGLIVPQLVAVGVLALSILVGLAHYDGASTVNYSCWALFSIAMLSAIVRAAAPQRAGRAGVAPDLETEWTERLTA